MSQSVDYPVGLLKQLNKSYIIHNYDTKVRNYVFKILINKIYIYLLGWDVLIIRTSPHLRVGILCLYIRKNEADQVFGHRKTYPCERFLRHEHVAYKQVQYVCEDIVELI